MFKKVKLALFAAFFMMVSFVQADEMLRLATTTSTYNSGLLDYLLPVYKEKTGVEVQVISVGTGAALRLGQDGDVDLVMTHAPEAEAAFVEAGHGIMPKALMYNDFVIVGPDSDPASLKTAENIIDAFSQIADSGSIFVSRGDESGTHMKELELWEMADKNLPFEGYRSVGQGMGRVLSLADEMEGYTLTDRGTWLAMKNRLDSVLVFEGDEQLFNPYQVILVNPERHPHTLYDQAKAFANWLVSAEGQDLIDSFQVEGEQLFFASAED
ncbi:substrate-binding domain-containing protein [Nitrincola schmidtii]|uniref:substrate-binding domain-containing protein n=1 Tax=Nitrincola schmidtii TaxID=1730894 RepID=UPI00197EF77A|nr:substrate-binding domain-containing protein [Nitrincola schmidtii]